MAISQVFYMGIIGLLVSPLLFVAPVQATTFPGQNGGIAFSRAQGGSSSIWTMKASGKQTPLRSSADSPVWSPDGRKLVFIDETANGRRLSIMNASGTSQRYLTRASGSDSSPVWSADGSKVAFVRAEKTSSGNTRSAVFTVRIDGSYETNVSGWLQSGGYQAPSWSPGGDKLVYEKYSLGQSQLLIKNLKTGTVRLLTTLSDGVSSRVSWSPSGKKILYSDSSNEVYTIWPDGNHRTVISDGESSEAAWSPRGDKIAFLEDRTGESISISEEDGSITYIPLQKGSYQSIGAPTWSPDGTKLIFTMSYDLEGRQTTDLVSLNVSDANGILTKLASGAFDQLNWQARR
jgi:Tol biopolymer transport system component